MKKILLLGGSSQQLVAINKAKEMGYYTIVCDYLNDNPGQYIADKFYLKSTTDKEEMLKIAKSEKIDGVIAYASDPAAPTAAYIAEKMNLYTNPYKSIDILCNKDKFRKFLKENDFNTPRAEGFIDKSSVFEKINLYQFPIIIKPVDSSGSKGATVLRENNYKELEDAIDFAFKYSRSNRIIVEEFIEKKHKYLVGGDIFILNGKIVVWGLLNCHRDNNVNPLVPVGKSYPLDLDEKSIKLIKKELQKLVDLLNIKNGAMNIELIIDSNDRVWMIDVGPRNGGNMIPDLLGDIFGIDIVEMSIKAAMGENQKIVINIGENELFATHNLHTSKNGLYKKIIFDEKLEQYLYNKYLYKNVNDSVEYFDNASKALGIIFLKFNTKDEMNSILENINELYNVELI